jgi:two-component system cell cycle sensor histidine kinase/response regulator CckA
LTPPAPAALAQQLAEAEATITALLAGQVDAVVDARSNTPVLLSKAQEALRQSEERYRRIVETTRDGVWMLDATRTTTFTNRRMREMLGCEAPFGVECSPFEFLDDDNRRKLEAYLQQPDRGQIDIRYTRRDGTSVWTLLEASPIMTTAGGYEGSMAMVVDITERKRAEMAVGHERDRAESYLDTAQVIMLAVDLSGAITMINRYGCSVIGWTAAELLGRNWVGTCVPVRFRAAVNARLGQLVAAESATAVLSVENAIVTKSGAERLIEWRNSVLRDAAGAVIGAITSGTDITDRTKAVEDLRKAEERMRFALESAEVGIWDWDVKTGVLSWSATLERQYGLAPNSFNGTFETFVALIHPEDRETALAVVARATTDGTDFSLNTRAIRPDGNVRFLNGFGRIHHDAQGHPTRGIGISLDVTERRALETRYQQAQKMDAIGQLASGVAHDFNNLLTVILGFTEFVLEDKTIVERHGGDLGEIIKAARRASGLTKQLLAFSRQQVLEMAPLDLNKIISEMTAMARRLIGEHIDIHLDLAPHLPLALSDRGQFEQVVMNLLVNARDAMPDGGKITIATTHRQFDNVRSLDEPVIDGRYVLLSVTDNGGGMTKETQRRLFEPFYTTKPAGKGTGLGLSTAYGIIKQSKGYIFVESEIGRGTTFTVYLPCVEGVAPAATAPDVVKSARPAVSETVLLVEDESAVREFSRRSLERAGYRVFVAEDGNEAERVFAARAAEIDIVLTDVVMPGCGGPELLARLRQRQPDMRVLYMSGYTEQSAANAIAFRGEPAVLQKPFNAADLRRRVREVLDAPLVASTASCAQS